MNEMPVAVLLSGSGTTLQNLINRRVDDSLPFRIVMVISSKQGVLGVERAKKAGLPTEVVLRKSYPSTDAFSEQIFSICRDQGAKLVCLAGFLQLLRIPDDYSHRVMNIHPALLPSFGGKGMFGHHVHEAVLASGVKYSGCTVHFADNEYDHGPIIAQRTVPVLDDDTAESLAARVFQQECEAYPEAIQAFAKGHLRIEGRRVLRNS